MSTRHEQLLSWAASQSNDAGRTIGAALRIAEHAHRDQTRRNGEPYIEHPLAVALIVCEHGADLDTVAAALLHDTTSTLTADPVVHLRPHVNATVAGLVADVDRLDREGSLALAGTDRRAQQIKVADRLHNMRTIAALPPATRHCKAGRTRDLVVPLARRVGMHDAATELDGLAATTLTDLRDHRPHARPVDSSLRMLRLAAVLLPAGCRDRWLTDWHGELHALPTRRARLGFALDVLLGLPTMAVLTRRTEHR